MAVYKLFPDKDNFIFTEVPTANAGYDEMIELGSYPVLEILTFVLLQVLDEMIELGSYPVLEVG